MIKVTEVKGFQVVLDTENGEFGLSAEDADKLDYHETSPALYDFTASFLSWLTKKGLTGVDGVNYLSIYIGGPTGVPMAVDATMLAQVKTVFSHDGMRYWRWPPDGTDELSEHVFTLDEIDEEFPDGSFRTKGELWRPDTPEARKDIEASVAAIHAAWLTHIPAALRQHWEAEEAVYKASLEKLT